MYKAKFISSTNPVFANRAGEKGKMGTMCGAIAFGTQDLGDAFCTSMILKYTQDGSRIKFQTLNSTYVFELLENERFSMEINEKAKELKKEMDLMNEIEVYSFHCCVETENIFDRFSKIIFDKKINREDALELIMDKEFYDDQNRKVVNILEPIIEG